MTLRRQQPFVTASITSVLVACFLLAISPADEPASPPVRSAESTLWKEPGEERSDNGLAMKLCYCPPGTFEMGWLYEVEWHVKVTLTQGFWIGKYEVTQAEYEQVVGKNPSHFSKTGDGSKLVEHLDTRAFPVESVNWDDAMDFCLKLTEAERKAGRLSKEWEYTLPGEAQWEYACRAGTTSRYAFGESISARDARFSAMFSVWSALPEGQFRSPTRVGMYRGNRWGIHDMHGNAWEWSRDYAHEQLTGGVDPRPMPPLPSRMSRGGKLACGSYECESSTRRAYNQNQSWPMLGFRVALCRVVAPTPKNADPNKMPVATE